ncbi:MAG: SAM-dependent methyltransferase [Bacteroidetes bacterium]|nr:SAM-dependent methyltransferase [Bacteroidota bacterium]MBL6962590.1 SAM-dependent methyltransferase [Bacteroidota bacterium]
MKGLLYLIPNRLASENADRFIPFHNKEIIRSLKHFIVENLKPARAFLKLAGVKTPFDDITFYELNKHSRDQEISDMISVLLAGNSVGLISDAGYPSIADPGEQIIFKAHQNGIQVIPLTGPSSILFAIASSGLNAEQFTFHAYLPVNENELKRSLKKLEKEIVHSGYTQVFIETPYRAQKIFDVILKQIDASLYLSICADLHSKNEFISTKSISEWRKEKAVLKNKLVVISIGVAG